MGNREMIRWMKLVGTYNDKEKVENERERTRGCKER